MKVDLSENLFCAFVFGQIHSMSSTEREAKDQITLCKLFFFFPNECAFTIWETSSVHYPLSQCWNINWQKKNFFFFVLGPTYGVSPLGWKANVIKYHLIGWFQAKTENIDRGAGRPLEDLAINGEPKQWELNHYD